MPDATTRHAAKRLTGAAALLLAAFGGMGTAAAEEIYKSVDADGNIIYSTRPVPEAVEASTIRLPKGPSEAAQREALKLQQAMERDARSRIQADTRRRETQKQSILDAEQRLSDARARLQEARTPQDEDWQTIAGGGRYLKESYHARIKQAEAEVKAAEKALSETRRDAR